MKMIFGAVDRLSRICGYAMMVVFLILVCDMMYEVVSRRIFNAPTLWAYDVAYMSNAAIFMVAASPASPPPIIITRCLLIFSLL